MNIVNFENVYIYIYIYFFFFFFFFFNYIFIFFYLYFFFFFFFFFLRVTKLVKMNNSISNLRVVVKECYIKF